MKNSASSQYINPFKKTLKNIRIVDFSRLLPGPFASSILAQMGAKVTCVLPPTPDPLLTEYSPFDWLRKGKKFLTADLKNKTDQNKVRKLIAEADVMLEGFRPGVLERLGFGFKQVKKWNAKLLYFSMTGYPQGSAQFEKAGHDLNFLVESGVYQHFYDANSNKIPALQLADLAGGYLLALQVLSGLFEPAKKRKAKHVYSSILEGMQFMQAYLAGAEHLIPILSGGLARYHIYHTLDHKRLVVAAIEPKFYHTFLKNIGLAHIKNDDPLAIEAITQTIATKTLAQWKEQLKNIDACLSFLD